MSSSSSPRPVPSMVSPYNNGNGNSVGRSPMDSSMVRRNSSRRNSGCEPRTSSPSVYHVSISLNLIQFVFILFILNFFFFQNNYRRGSLEAYGSPPNSNAAYFPHDLDDIYEYKTDHQYFTHTGATPHCHSVISSDSHRNQFFLRTPHAQSLDEYSTPERSSLNRARFDNSSFIKSLSGESSAGKLSESSNSPRDKSSSRSNSLNNNQKKEHSSVHEMIKNFGKKVHIWPSRRRHESTSVITSPATTPLNDPQENFRLRSKSLDVKPTNSILNDCDATYKIYDKIVREGKF